MIRLRVLGATDLLGADNRELRTVLAQPKRLALLAYLAVESPPRFHRRDTLTSLFWPEHDQEHARNALRQAIHHLRQAIGTDVVLNRGSEELALDGRRLWCDASAFEQALDANDPAAALELYSGDLLPGFFISAAPAFDQWLDEQRARLRARACDAAWTLAERAAAAGDLGGATRWARRAARQAPDDERGTRRLIALLVQSGDRAGAARAYEAFAEWLATEFEVEPSPETQALAASLRERHPDKRPVITTPRASAATDTGPWIPVAASPASLPRRKRPRRWWIASAAGVAGVALLLALVPRGAQTTSASSSLAEAVAVLPFEIRGNPELGYLREGVVDLLSTKLEGTAGLRSIDPRTVLATVRTDSAALRSAGGAGRIAQRVGARWYVVGDVIEIAGRLHLDAALYDASDNREPAATADVEGEVLELFTLVDDLAARLLAARTRGRDTVLTRLAAITTHSLPALKSFLDGERAFRQGRDAHAVAAFENAIALDSNFALAYYRLAVAARWSTSSRSSARAPEIAAHAVRLGDRLPPVARRLLTGYHAYLTLDANAAEAIFREVRTSHPDNIEAWFMEAETLFHFSSFRGGSFLDAKEAFERVMALDPADPHAILHLTRIAATERRFARLDFLITRFLEMHGGADRSIQMHAVRAFASGDTAAQAAVARELRDVSDATLGAVLLDVTTNLQEWRAAPILAPAYDVPGRIVNFTSHGFMVLSQLPLARGIRRQTPDHSRITGADPDWLLEAQTFLAVNPVATVQQADALALRDRVESWRAHPVGSPSLFAYHATHQPQLRALLLGLLSVKLGEASTARHFAEQLDQFSAGNADGGVGEDFAHIVRAAIANSEGNVAAALRAIERFRFDPVTPTQRAFTAAAYARFLRAELLLANRRTDEALRWYASFPDPNGLDLIHLAPSHLRRAEIYEGRRDRKLAAANYARFIELWQDCDEELRPLVERAKSALERLKA